MLEVIDIFKNYENKPLLRGTRFSVSGGETICLLGPSGGGKSTLLRIIAGLEPADAGLIRWNGKDLADTAPHQRNFGFMFQDYALFPHRSVAENIAFGLRMKGVSAAERDTRVRELLDLVNLPSFGERRVTELSGGEQQRIALARALAPHPQLLMLDEPLGALDRTLAEQLAAELRQILRAAGTPTIYVTHDQREAFTVAERILLIHEGKIIQEGSPKEVYQQPATLWAARFLGLTNFLEGRVIATTPCRVRTPIGTFEAMPGKTIPTENENVHLLIRSAEGKPGPNTPRTNHIHGLVEDAVFQGNMYRVDIRCQQDLRMRFYITADYQGEAEIDLYFNAADACCIPR